MSDDWFTLIAVVVGGTITLAGTILADWLRDKRERGRAEKERVRTSSYAVQDAVADLLETSRRALIAKWPNEIGIIALDPDHVRAVLGTNKAIQKVGDYQLGREVGKLLDALSDAMEADTIEEANTHLSQALELWGPVNRRMGKLLFEDVEVDTGVNPDSSR